MRAFADLLVGYTGTELSVHEHDPIVNMLQWAGESADPPVYTAPDTHVLMMQGIVDTYILPPIANATSLSMRLDLAGQELDRGHPSWESFCPSWTSCRSWARNGEGYPLAGNADGVTRAVTQHIEDDVEDGHEVVFQTIDPKAQYRCFLSTWLAGTPQVVDPTEGLFSVTCFPAPN